MPIHTSYIQKHLYRFCKKSKLYKSWQEQRRPHETKLQQTVVSTLLLLNKFHLHLRELLLWLTFRQDKINCLSARNIEFYHISQAMSTDDEEEEEGDTAICY